MRWGLMRIESKVDFKEVRHTYLAANPDPSFGSTTYALGLLDAANEQFREWHEVVLSSGEVLTIMLPWHRHKEFELVPTSGLIVRDALYRLALAPQGHDCPRRVEALSVEPPSAVYLSVAPLNRYMDYRELVRRNYRGLTHLDGLHRLIAWARSGHESIMAYVAGAL
jgi:uncharacterized protein DUF6309